MTALGFEHRFMAAGEEVAPRTLLVLHGTGGDEDSLLDIARSVAPEMNLLSPRGKVNENGASRFFRRFQEGVFDVEDIRRQAADLATFVSDASREYGFDASAVVAFGYSNGANTASSLMLLHPSALTGAVLVRAMVPLVPDPLPELAGKRLLILNGRFDPLEPPGETERLANLLSMAGAELEVHLAEAGHELTKADLRAAQAWLALQ